MERSRVILVEDHKPSQTAYTALLEPEFEVVGVLADASRLLPHVSETQPNIVILDIALPGKSGFQAARELREYFPHVNIIFLTTNQSPEYVQEAFALGASAYVLKVSAVSDLPAAIRAALIGQRFISPGLSS
jgi:DNA-binding NarL/FixJ family response regulator